MRLFLVTACLFTASSLGASPESGIVIDRFASTADVRVDRMPLSDLIDAARLRTGTAVDGNIPARVVTIDIEDVPVGRLMETILSEAGVGFIRMNHSLVIQDQTEATVSLDVVRASADQVIRSVAEQCDIRNVMIDPEVRGRRATFRLVDLPCRSALRAVCSTLGIEAEIIDGSVLSVRGRR